ncbi:MAG: hypothetical protein JW955_13285 [Sedimentisphaerales bacterium]|nr:hypothetical protein [Sedimentisphaerales bacterium]
MDQERIAVLDLADELGVRKQRLFKLIKALHICTTKRREPTRGGQEVVTIAAADTARIRNELQARSRQRRGSRERPDEQAPYYASDERGVFYLVQLEPQHDPTRFKVGFTADIESRLGKLRTSAPFARCEKSWPCRRNWEGTAIDCVTDGCEHLREEVFRASRLVDVVHRADAFFSVMPRLSCETSEKGQTDASPGGEVFTEIDGQMRG